MDPNPPRHPRGRARGQSQVPPPNQGQSRGPLRHQAQLQAPPPNQGQSRPRGPPLNQGLPQIPSSYREQALTFHTTQAPPSRPQPNIPDQLNPQQQFRPQNVEQVTSGLENLKTGGAEKIQGQKMKLLESLGEKCTKMYNFFKLKNDTHNSSNKKLTESTEDALIPIGRGAIRGRQPLESTYYRIERPASSTSSTGKQGAGGQPIELISNYFPIKTYTDWSLYQYRVDFNPIQDRINIERGLLSVHKDVLGEYIFDGFMLFSSKKYQQDTIELTSKKHANDEMVIITIKFTSVIEKGDHTSVQVFNLLLRKCLAHLELSLVGRNYYNAKAPIDIPKYNLQLWPGYETTIGMYDSGLLLRAEISTKIMREDTVLDFLTECASERQTNPNWMDKFKIGVIGSIVLTKYNNQTYRIDDVDENCDTQSTFLLNDGSSISYVDYYRKKHELNLSGILQPMLVSKKKKSFKIPGDESKWVYLIPELCTMTGLTTKMRDNHYLMADLAMYTRIGPTERIGRYNNFMDQILTTPESADLLTQWNLTLSNKLVTIPGRVLPQEMLQVNEQKFSTGNDANWTAQLCSSSMFTCAEIKRWAVLCPEGNSNQLRQFIQTLLKVAKNMSFNLPLPEIVELPNTNISTYLTTIDKLMNQMNPSFILCVMTTNRADNYSAIKKHLCIDRPVPSQIVLLRQINDNNMSVCTKIAIQINCKLGGAPWRVVIPEKNMMIVGFDVCHDSQNKNKSYGALIATMNDSHTSYFSCVQPHERGQEISSYFALSIAKALSKYKHKNNKLPNSIVIYRDTPSQLSYVHRTEVEMIKKTCKDFYGEQKVGMAFIIVKKQNNSRFFCNIPGNYRNPPPGTVVDNTVTDPTMYDFYLVSQHVTKGTVTPTHYNVIIDTLSETTDATITPAILQKLTYKLTHMYYNWSGTVRVPAPCQLAHKLASFTAQSLKNPANSDLEDLLYFL